MDTTTKPRARSGATRSTWSGSISFGMISVPVRMYNATVAKDLAFTTLHRNCPNGQNQPKQAYLCPACSDANGQPVFVSAEDRERAYEVSRGRFVPITDEELAALAVPSLKEITLTSFTDAGSVDRKLVKGTYWLEPEDLGRKPYALLINAMARKNVIGIGKLSMSNKERIVALRVLDEVLVLETLYYPEELRAMDSGNAPAPAKVVEQELQMAEMLVEAYRGEFVPSEYSDAWRASAQALIESKISGTALEAAPVAALPEPPTDMMAALQATLEMAKAARAAKEAAKAA